ncbi:MAG: rhodanese-like domain-containing protein [Alphaproteobacteria bacterium]|nr:rhodanese-like domain-containing protein [Alphaproteobacteria bacterium]
MLQRGFRQMVGEAEAAVEVISVEDGLALVGDAGVIFIDVREMVERRQTGCIPGSVHVPRGFLEFRVDPDSPMHDKAVDGAKRLVLYCASGGRSALAAKTMLDMGFANVCFLGGGLGAWNQAGGQVEQD